MIRPVTRAAWLPFGGLLAYGAAWASAALGISLLANDDHPGQFFRFWHALVHGVAPWTWNPDWWMGFAELQFYPPGFAYAGVVLAHLGLGLLPPPATYQALLWLIFLAPGVTTFVLLARLLPNPWLALPGSAIAMTLSAETMSGVEGGLRIGMVSARLGWALLPLLVLALVRWMPRGSAVAPGPAGLLAAIVLSHPAHAPAAIVYVGLAALLGAGPLPRRLTSAVLVVVLAAGLTAFWTVPLAWHLEEARPLAWGDPAFTLLRRSLHAGPLLPMALVFALAAVVVRRDRAALLLTLFVPVMTAVVALDPSSFLPANRLADSLVLGIILAAGLGLGGALALLVERRARRRRMAAAVLVIGLLVIAARDDRGLVAWPSGRPWPTLAEVTERLRLAELWRALDAAPPGRVLYVRSGAPLHPSPRGSRQRHPWYRPHTHVTALTPLTTGRAIVNGTFTHPSAMAGLVYSGSPRREPIRQLVEQLDGERLFGEPLAAITPATLERFLDLFGASAVVILEEDEDTLPALTRSERFRRVDAWPHVVYVAHRSQPLPERLGRDHWRVTVENVAGGWVSTRVSFSPLWRAVANDAPIPSRRGPLGELQVKPASPAPEQARRSPPAAPGTMSDAERGSPAAAPPAVSDRGLGSPAAAPRTISDQGLGSPAAAPRTISDRGLGSPAAAPRTATIDLWYGPGKVEWLGVGVSAVTLVVWAGLMALQIATRPRRGRAGGRPPRGAGRPPSRGPAS
jgi:hypothetical protein